MFPLACINAVREAAPQAVERSSVVAAAAVETVGDLAPLGVVMAAIVLHVFLHKTKRTSDRVLILTFGALLGTLAGAAFGLAFQVSALGVATIPLFLFALVSLEVRARAPRPRPLPKRMRTKLTRKKPRSVARRRHPSTTTRARRTQPCSRSPAATPS
jgi:hypothetical protein